MEGVGWKSNENNEMVSCLLNKTPTPRMCKTSVLRNGRGREKWDSAATGEQNEENNKSGAN